MFPVWQGPLWFPSVPLSFLVFPETNELRCAEGKPFPLLALPQFFVTSWFLFCFCFYFHPSALNNVLRAGSSCGPLWVWGHSPAPPASSWSLRRNVPDCVHTPMSCKIVLRKLPNEVAWEFEIDLGTGETAETETKHACARSSTSPHSGCCLLFLKQGTQASFS